MCVHSSLNKFPSGQDRWCIMANPKVLTPVSYEGEMRHTVPLYCYKSFFVNGWQLFIRSNLFKPPLRELTFSTLTHLQFTNLTADLLLKGGKLASMLISTQAVHCVGLGRLGEGKGGEAKRWTGSEYIYLTLTLMYFNVLICYTTVKRSSFAKKAIL